MYEQIYRMGLCFTSFFILFSNLEKQRGRMSLVLCSVPEAVSLETRIYHLSILPLVNVCPFDRKCHRNTEAN
jgi:hypothetical protein